MTTLINNRTDKGMIRAFTSFTKDFKSREINHVLHIMMENE